AGRFTSHLPMAAMLRRGARGGQRAGCRLSLSGLLLRPVAAALTLAPRRPTLDANQARGPTPGHRPSGADGRGSHAPPPVLTRPSPGGWRNPGRAVRLWPRGTRRGPFRRRGASGKGRVRMSEAHRMFIDGQWTAADSGRTFTVTDPASGEAIGEVADGGA